MTQINYNQSRAKALAATAKIIFRADEYLATRQNVATAQRNLDIMVAYANGITLEVLSAKIGLCPARTRQIVIVEAEKVERYALKADREAKRRAAKAAAPPEPVLRDEKADRSWAHALRNV